MGPHRKAGGERSFIDALDTVFAAPRRRKRATSRDAASSLTRYNAVPSGKVDGTNVHGRRLPQFISRLLPDRKPQALVAPSRMGRSSASSLPSKSHRVAGTTI